MFLRLIICSGFVLVALGLGSTPAQAQLADVLSFRTDFSFMIGNRQMPPGAYEVRRVGDDSFLFEVRGARTAFFEVNNAGAAPEVGAKQDEILFVRHGETLVLSEVWDADSGSGVVTIGNRKDSREASNQAAEVISVAALRGAGAIAAR
jgi:hypothetical protein